MIYYKYQREVIINLNTDGKKNLIREKYYNDSGNHSLSTIVESANIITSFKSIFNSTNFAKKWEHAKVERWTVGITHMAWCAFEGLARVMRRAGCGYAGGVQGEGWAVVCSGPLDVAQGQGEWLTTKIQQNKRWRRGVWAGTRCGSQNTDAARTGRESGAARDALKIDARSANGIQHSYVIATSNPWWVTSRRSHATTSRDSVNMRSAIGYRVVLRFDSQLNKSERS